MYIVDLFKRMFRKANFAVLIYLVLNVFVIGTTCRYLAAHPIGSAMDMPMWQAVQIPGWLAFGAGVALYAVSLAIALSPVGEWILRLQTGCKPIKRKEQIAFIEPIFREVKEKAKKVYPMLPDNVQVFLCGERAPNAFATGRRTICITEGMLHMPEDQIKAALAHECGHLANHDTDLILLVSVGNLVVSGIILAIRLLLIALQFLISVMASVLSVAGGLAEGLNIVTGAFKIAASFMNVAYSLVNTYVLGTVAWLWTKLGMLLVMHSGRAREFEADAGAFNMGHGEALCQLLDQNACAESARGLFASLADSHPDRHERIARLQDLGVTYRAVYGR